MCVRLATETDAAALIALDSVAEDEPQRAAQMLKPAEPDKEIDLDAAMTASDAERLRQAFAEFGQFQPGGWGTVLVGQIFAAAANSHLN